MPCWVSPPAFVAAQLASRDASITALQGGQGRRDAAGLLRHDERRALETGSRAPSTQSSRSSPPCSFPAAELLTRQPGRASQLGSFFAEAASFATCTLWRLRVLRHPCGECPGVVGQPLLWRQCPPWSSSLPGQRSEPSLTQVVGAHSVHGFAARVVQPSTLTPAWPEPRCSRCGTTAQRARRTRRRRRPSRAGCWPTDGSGPGRVHHQPSAGGVRQPRPGHGNGHGGGLGPANKQCAFGPTRWCRLRRAAGPTDVSHLTPGQQLLFACRYRLTPQLRGHMSEVDNVYDPLWQLRGRRGRLEHGQDVHRAAKWAKLHFGAHFQTSGLPNQTAGTVDVYGLNLGPEHRGEDTAAWVLCFAQVPYRRSRRRHAGHPRRGAAGADLHAWKFSCAPTARAP